MTTFLQINADRSAAAIDLAWATAVKYGSKYILVSEPNIAATRGPRWFRDLRGDAAIGFVGQKSGVVDTGSGNGFVWIRTVDNTVIFSCCVPE